MRARLTDADPSARYWRADAVEVVQASPDRVPARCPVSGAGGCGGCDVQHVGLAAQRRLKAQVVAEQLGRLAGIEWPGLVVEAVPGDAEGLGWRTRVRFAVDEAGRAGLRRHRSHDIVPLQDCPIAAPGINALEVPQRLWPGVAAVEVVAPGGRDAGEPQDPLVVVEPTGTAATQVGARVGARVDVPPLAAPSALARASGRGTAGGLERLRGRTWVREQVLVDGAPRTFRVTGSGFWQVHPGAAQMLLDAVLDAARPQPGERALDLYSGVGLFAAGLALRVGGDGGVLAVESDPRAVSDARRNLHDLPQVQLAAGRVERDLAALVGPGTPWHQIDIVVADPPRQGLGKGVVAAIARLAPRVLVLVACDPAAMARDVARAAQAGYYLSGLRAFDAFPMTAHVECVAVLRVLEKSGTTVVVS